MSLGPVADGCDGLVAHVDIPVSAEMLADLGLAVPAAAQYVISSLFRREAVTANWPADPYARRVFAYIDETSWDLLECLGDLTLPKEE